MKPQGNIDSGSLISQSSGRDQCTGFWGKACSELIEGRMVLVIIVARCRKGSPGTPGAKMLILEEGRTVGTIGGGIMEARAQERARPAFFSDSYEPKLVEVDHFLGSEQSSGLVCGGGQTNIIIRLSPNQDLDTIKQFVLNLTSDIPSVLEISPQGIELTDHVGSSFFHQRLIQKGDCWKFELGSVNLKRCAIYGAGHCGQALARQLNWLGYSVKIFDARLEQRLEVSDLGIESSNIGHPNETPTIVRFPRHTSAIVMTHSYQTDVDALEFALKMDFRFIGLMGTTPKLNRIYKTLTDRGFNGAQLTNITCPVGIAIGSDTPEEIAVSVAAQILRTQKTGNEFK